MEALRQIVKPKNNKVTFTLPSGFVKGFVEVIVMPFNEGENINKIPEKKNGKNHNNSNLQKLLLEAPTMTDIDYTNFLEKQNHFNKWNLSV
jgi:hypothetical protein